MPGKVLIPEVVEPDEALPPDLRALRRFARLMDEEFPIPGTRKRFGVDAALGLVPVVGDVIAALLSLWIVFGALRHRVPTRKVLRMLFNILLDAAVGAVPILGDIFDFLFEENTINLQLLLRYRDRRRPPRTPSQVAGTATLIVAGVLAFILFLLAGLVAAMLALIRNR
ncbi:MAG TPA: DUF4112 domain-containing protein [Thermoanaerobaculia bacterium]|jgi:hypothetical protein|nr:DUF4112 domain-containing protein [Thermoanaerobaculia bacterium]